MAYLLKKNLKGKKKIRKKKKKKKARKKKKERAIEKPNSFKPRACGSSEIRIKHPV